MTMTAEKIDMTLPTTDEETGAPAYTVEYRDLDRHETVRVEFGSELDAIRAIGSYELYVNTELIGYGPNVDRSKYRL